MGQVSCNIVSGPIDTDACVAFASGQENGGIVTFVGQVRLHSRGKEVEYLEYDAYVPLAVKQMTAIAEHAAEKWNCDISLVHRIGKMGLCEAAVVVSAGSPHRSQAFEACQYCIDTVKEDVPIWKKEVCPDGAFWIEGEQPVLAT